MSKERVLKIGNVVLNNPFLLAPLAGITDSPFRRLCKEQGASLVYSEMVSAKGLYYDGKKTEDLLKYYPEEEPIAFQIFGSEPEIMAWAVEKLSDRGNSIIDINMGCPVPKVTKNGEGSALMKNPILAGEIVKAMIKAEEISANKIGRTEKPITVKCRIGWDEDSINIREFAKRIEDAGASALTVHGRTRNQMYSGKADWETIAETKAILSIPVIGNGDAHTGVDAMRMLKETGCDFVMIARGALGNPWIFKEALELYRGQNYDVAQYDVPSIIAGDKLEMIKKHIDLLVEEKGQRRGVQEMRKHMGWYLKGTTGAAKFRNKINMASTLEDVYAFLEDLKALMG